ncbi:MAG: glycosyl hydrolase family 28-related protein [Planctomycetota bacterium]|nr:glycosyl hydrolase family 28-related protein [Planctomycetota bacterium]
MLPRFMIALLGMIWMHAAWAASADEFVGPFPSWKNVKTDYGAVGDGKADDTPAIQKALDDLRLHPQSHVLYFPAGTYRITKTIGTRRQAHTDCMGIAIVGEDPANTIILWDGPEAQTMFLYDAWYSKISRLTLDGAAKAKIALAYGGGFSTYNETSDMVFQNVVDGLAMATGDNGQAENEVLRCTFRRCSGAGIRTNNFNSLDIWAWYCLFEDCAYGLYNGAGNFHAWHCVFLRSTKMDIASANLMTFSFVNNFSIGSKCFMDWSGGHSWGSPTSITGNRIIDCTGDFSIRLGNAGPYLLADNVIRNRDGNAKPPVILTWGDQALVGNTYTVSDAVVPNGRFRRIDEKVVDRNSIDTTIPKLPPTPPKVARPRIELTAGANADAIQAAIDQAAKLKGQRPVVHLPVGRYKLDRTLTVPPAVDVQIVGDGAGETATVLEWAGPQSQPMLTLQGPSLASLRDLNLHAPGATALRIEACDQNGGRIFADQLNVNAAGNSKGIGVHLNAVDHTDLLFRCLQGGGCGVWAQATGGPDRQARRNSPGQLSILTGATGSSIRHYAVANGAQLVVRGIYHEVSANEPQAVSLADSGILSIDATRFSCKTSPEVPLFSLNGFQGNLTLLTSFMLPVDTPATGRIDISGDGSNCNLLAMGNMFWVNEPGVTTDKVLRNHAIPPAHAAIALSNLNSGKHLPKGSATLDDSGQADDAFVLKMLAPLRQNRVWLPQDDLPPGCTNVRIRRIIVTSGAAATAVEILGLMPGRN